jgi:hypothetical protein
MIFSLMTYKKLEVNEKWKNANLVYLYNKDDTENLVHLDKADNLI